jgi:hypothetical protein
MTNMTRQIQKRIRAGRKDNRDPVVITLGQEQYEQVIAEARAWKDPPTFEETMQQTGGAHAGLLFGVPMRICAGNVFGIGFRGR